MSILEVLEWARSLKESLRKKNYKVAGPEPFGTCIELVVDAGDIIFYVYAYPGRHSDTIILKITPDKMECQEALLTPRGLIIIAEEPDEAASRISSLAAKRVAKIARLPK